MQHVSTLGSSAALIGLGTALPASISQENLADQLASRCCDTDVQRAKFQRVFANSGVSSRGCVVAGNISIADQTIDEKSLRDSLAQFFPARKNIDDLGPTTKARLTRYAIEAPPLAEAAARAALIDAQRPASRITHLITVSCTGFFAPGLDVELIQRLSLSPSVTRLHIGFMGCHGAFNAIAAARAIVLADANASVLVCCVELCSLHFQYGWNPQQLIANALFADGAAAVVIESIRAGAAEKFLWKIRAIASRLLPRSTDAMTWTIGDHGFAMTLSPVVPSLVEKNLSAWCDVWLGEAGSSRAAIQNFAVHPGGPRVLDAVERSLSPSADSIQTSRKILRDHGNISSTTILFILDQARGQVGTTMCLGFGPGLMMEGMLLDAGTI